MARTIVYDFGMNNGDDVDYYLAKGHAVVAVEANPVLCEVCAIRFAAEIEAGRLTILNAVVTDAEEEGEVDFYIHKTNHVLSQFPAPRPDLRANFYRIRLPGIPAATIVRRHGDPHYVKIDLEGFDQNILRSLFAAGIRPTFLSAESHSVEVFALLCAFGYKSFNLVDGESVRDVYRSAVISCETGRRRYDFKFHSAGPYGYDLTSPWLDAEAFFYLLAKEGLGWKDIHASLTYMPRRFAPALGTPVRRSRWDFETGHGWPATRSAPPVEAGEAGPLPGYPAAALSRPAGFAKSA
jgi:FkbM family methyltransferase